MQGGREAERSGRRKGPGGKLGEMNDQSAERKKSWERGRERGRKGKVDDVREKPSGGTKRKRMYGVCDGRVVLSRSLNDLRDSCEIWYFYPRSGGCGGGPPPHLYTVITGR